MKKVGGWGGPFMQMVYVILGLVLFMSMFSSIMSALATLRSGAYAATFVAWTTIIGIAPAILLLGGAATAGFVYTKGAMGTGAFDPSGLMRLVLGVLQMILFATLFDTVGTSFYTIYTTYCGAANDSVWIALRVVVIILPTVLFLAGLFGGLAVAAVGAKSYFKKHKKSNANVAA